MRKTRRVCGAGQAGPCSEHSAIFAHSEQSCQIIGGKRAATFPGARIAAAGLQRACIGLWANTANLTDAGSERRADRFNLQRFVDAQVLSTTQHAVKSAIDPLEVLHFLSGSVPGRTTQQRGSKGHAGLAAPGEAFLRSSARRCHCGGTKQPDGIIRRAHRVVRPLSRVRSRS